MDSQHRKIELQSPSDLSYLTTLLRAAALQKLNLHLPPVTSTSSTTEEPDDLRRNVETLVDTFVAQVLQGMRQNISINGIDVVSAEGNDNIPEGEGESLVEKEEFEPFDDKLRTQLGAAVAKRDALVAKISQHRRSTAAAAAEGFVERFEREKVGVDEVLGVWDQKARDEAVGAEVLSVGDMERQAEVERNWERAVQGLQRLNKGLPETRARLERAGDVLGYLEGEGQQKGGR